jgi:hypothetical protein
MEKPQEIQPDGEPNTAGESGSPGELIMLNFRPLVFIK